MADRTDVTVEQVFGLLDKWRHLPAYQLERRADIFFALFLPEVLGGHLSREGRAIEINSTLVPEFPIKKGGNYQSTKVDFLALSEDRELALLVELKTDMASKGMEQQELLIETAKRGLRRVVEDSIKILRRRRTRSARQKYLHLFHRLHELGMLVCDREDLYQTAFSEDNRGIYDILETIEPASWICDDRPRLEALYVQPMRCKTDLTCVVDFETFARIVERRGRGDIARRFCGSLRTWAARTAGEPDPRTLQS